MSRKNRLAIALMLASAGPIFAQDSGQNDPTPEGVVRQCTRTLVRATKRSVRAMRHTTQHSVTLITKLNEAGRDEAAAAVAQRTTILIGRITERGLSRIAELADRCAAQLGEIGAPPEMLDVLDERVDRAIGAVTQAQEAAVAAIAEALART
ncbi:MAG: hypothetical protein ACE5E5_06205 [Phycisphaerae bacterium]